MEWKALQSRELSVTEIIQVEAYKKMVLKDFYTGFKLDLRNHKVQSSTQCKNKNCMIQTRNSNSSLNPVLSSCVKQNKTKQHTTDLLMWVGFPTGKLTIDTLM